MSRGPAVRWLVRAALAFVPALLVGLATAGSATAAPGNAGALGLTVEATPRVVRPGHEVTITVTVHNEFDVAFGSVTVRALGAPGCTRPDLGRLAAGATKTYGCAVTAPKRPGAHQVSVSATAKTGFESFDAEASVTYKVKPAPTKSPTTAPTKAPTASPTASHSPAPRPSAWTSAEPGLPVTGTSSAPIGLAAAGVLLLAGGGLLVILARRRESHG